MDDIFIRYVPMEVTVPAVTSKDENGDYNLYVNCNVGYNAQQKGIQHEINHIRSGHFEADMSVEECEAEAEGKAVPRPLTLKEWRNLAGFKFMTDAVAYLETDYVKYMLCELDKHCRQEDVDFYIRQFKTLITAKEYCTAHSIPFKKR